jgi:hypothetical protein
MNEDNDNAERPDGPEASPAGAIDQLRDARRVAARRKFLRYGASSSAAMVATVSHRRAFAKKGNAVASQCTSLRGIPDLTKGNSKKALVTSALGKGKSNIICRPKLNDPNKTDCTVKQDHSQYVDSRNNQMMGTGSPYPLYDGDKCVYGVGKLGTGYIPRGGNDASPLVNAPYEAIPTSVGSAGFEDGTLTRLNLWRLYEKGWCPIVYDANGLRYDTNAKYYVKDHVADQGPRPCQ